jgi:hypothetical protein
MSERLDRLVKLEQRICLRITELEGEAADAFNKSAKKGIHILMRSHYRQAHGEMRLVILELENLLK